MLATAHNSSEIEPAILWLQARRAGLRGVRNTFFNQGMQSSISASYDYVKAFSETDLTGDLKKIEVPALILHQDADQIVLIADSASRT